MMNDEEYILYMFDKKFNKFKNRKIVLYGKGPKTKLILEHFPQYNIMGIMDREVTHGRIYGKPILTYKDLSARGVDLIIPIARPDSVIQIYFRLYDFCLENHIMLYSLDGENLFEVFPSPDKKDGEPDFLEVFREKFRDCWNKKIVLYGKGPRTEQIIEAFPDYHIIGIMDKTEREGVIYGKRILDYEETVSSGTELIIVVSKQESLPFVYHRISGFCSYHGIQLFDVEGNNLYDTQKGSECIRETDPYYEFGEEDLRRQIDEHSVISFDVFDTLIMRKTLYPVDVYELVEARAEALNIGLSGFRKLRYQAEMDTVAEIPNIYRIYNVLQALTGISEEQKECLLELELETEKQVMLPRSKMVEIMVHAIDQGKQVYLISDMYLPGRVLENLLDHVGIKGYGKLFVSCDYHKNKVTGLYAEFKDEVKGDSYLHIGDNFHADGTYARQNGMDTFIIKKSAEMQRISTYSPIQGYTTNVNERTMVGLFLASALNDPFSLSHTDGRIVLDDVYALGYRHIGPLITTFIIWLIEQVEKGGYDKILFSSRDGYLIQKLYDRLLEKWEIEDAPEGIYFQSSRHAAVCASMQTEEDIRWISSLPYFSTPEMMIHQSFDLPMEKVLPYDDSVYETIVDYGLAHKDQIFENSKRLAARYLTYMEKIGLKKDQRYALFDFVSSGTCHFSLSKIVPFCLEGIYMCNYDCEKPDWRALPSKSLFIQNRVKQDNTYGAYVARSYFFNNYLLLESVITSQEPTLIGFTDEGNPVFGEESRTEEELQYVAQVQRGIEDFFEDYTAISIRGIPIDERLADRMYSFKDLRYTNERCKILDNFFLREDMIHGNLPLTRNV